MLATDALKKPGKAVSLFTSTECFPMLTIYHKIENMGLEKNCQQ